MEHISTHGHSTWSFLAIASLPIALRLTLNGCRQCVCTLTYRHGIWSFPARAIFVSLTTDIEPTSRWRSLLSCYHAEFLTRVHALTFLGAIQQQYIDHPQISFFSAGSQDMSAKVSCKELQNENGCEMQAQSQTV